MTTRRDEWEVQKVRLEVRGYQDDDVCIVRVGLVTATNHGRVFTGSSKRKPGDKRDREVGFAVALGRALEALAESLNETAVKDGLGFHTAWWESIEDYFALAAGSTESSVPKTTAIAAPPGSIVTKPPSDRIGWKRRWLFGGRTNV